MKIRKRIGLVLFLMGCFLFIACGGGGGGGDSDDPGGGDTPTFHSTGNQDFNVADAMNADPLGDYRTEAAVGDALPVQVDHSTLMPQVRSQGNTGSCSAWANGYYTKSFQEAQEEGWDVDENVFSPGYLYAMQCRHYSEFNFNGRPLKSPQNVLVSYGILKKYGCVKWSTMPYEDLGFGQNIPKEVQAYANLEIPQGADDEARIYRCGDTTFVGGTAIDQIKNLLTKGPIAASIFHWDEPPPNPSSEENYLRYNAAKDTNGHAIALVGYDDTKFGTGAFKFVNSWGADWAEDGFSWIRYADAPKIIANAMSFQDLTNPDNPDDPPNADKRPDPPSDVDASDDVGNYVDVTWSPVSGAQYYRIYRSAVENHNGYEDIGTAYQGNYRDNPTPGVEYYYAVVAVNDLGESDHSAGDTDSEGYIDIGSAIGGSRLTTPTLTWESNDEEGSSFTVSDIDPAATSMEVQVSKNDSGPWESLGWIKPEVFTIKWGENSEYVNKQPYVRVRVTNADASSDFSNAVQVGEDVPTDAEVGTLNIVVFDAQESSMLLRWLTSGNVDFVEIWRYCASNNTDNDWVNIGYRDSSQPDQDGFINYEDTTPKPGIPYYYALVPVYQGAYGKVYKTDKPYQVEAAEANLHLVSFQYYYTQISLNTAFPNVVVRNDGSTDIPSYSIGILAKSWADGKVSLVGRRTVTTPLEAGQQQRFDIDNFMIPAEFVAAGVFSWGIMVDYDESIDEVYESDNIKWSNDGWWLSPSSNSAATVSSGQAQTQRMGSSRVFGQALDASDPQRSLSTDTGENVGDDLEMIYTGPAIFKQPDFCIRHDVNPAQ